MYRIECFRLLESQRRKIKVLFNIIIRRIFKLSKFSSVRKIFAYAGYSQQSVPGNKTVGCSSCRARLISP